MGARSKNANGTITAARKALSRRDFLKLGGTGLAGAAMFNVAGCGSGRSDDSGALVFAQLPDRTGVTQTLVDKFNRQYRGDIRVEVRNMPADRSKFFDQIRGELQAGGGNSDVIMGDVIWPAQFAAQGWIADLSDRFAEDMRAEFLDGPLESEFYEGKVYGVPFHTEAGMLYYRRDLLERSGFSEPPGTWAELKDTARKVQQDRGTRSGFVFQGAEYEGGVCDGLEYIWTHGGNVLDPEDPEKVVIDSPESAAGLRTERSMVDEGVAPEAVTIYKEQESAEAFLRGDAVFMRNWAFVYALVTGSSDTEVRPEQIGITRIPTVSADVPSTSSSGGSDLYINAASDKQDEAWEFIKFMTAPEQQKAFALKASQLPTLKALYEDEEILERMPVVALGKEAIANTQARPSRSPYYSDMSLAMAEQFNKLLKGEITPEWAVETLQRELGYIARESQT